MIIKPLIKYIDDEALALVLQLADIVERLTAVEYRQYEIDILVEDRIISYLDHRKEIYDEYPILGRPKPKMHFLTHYGQAIRKFGSPLSFRTGCFEAKHKIAKEASESAKNFKNILATVSLCYQMRMASVYYAGMFETEVISIPEKVIEKREIAPDSEFHRSLREFMSETDVICSEVIVNNQKYVNGDIVVIEATGYDSLKVGWIQSILVKAEAVFFVTKRYLARRNQLGFFITYDAEKESSFINSNNLADFKPLIAHGTISKFKFALHHHVSFCHP